MEHSIAVVDPGQDQTTSQCLCQFRSQQVSNVSDGLCSVIAALSRTTERDIKESWHDKELAVDAKKSALGVTDSTAADGGTETVTNHDRYLDLIHQRAAPVRRRTPTSTRLPCLNQTPSAVFDPNPFNDTPVDTVDVERASGVCLACPTYSRARRHSSVSRVSCYCCRPPHVRCQCVAWFHQGARSSAN